MPFHLDRKLARVGSRMPIRLLRRGLAGALDGLHLALCLHRVREPSPEDWSPGMAMAATEIDSLLELLLASRRGGDRWLSVTFDDGYADAAAYVATRARRFPEVEFILFVCPRKAECGAGFRWDLARFARRHGLARAECAHLVSSPRDIDRENAREELRRVGADAEFRLASPSALRDLLGIPNVALGNHTNCHFDTRALAPETVKRELKSSVETFSRLFGRQQHFAFPFGHRFFDETHVRAVREVGDLLIWSTGQRPYAPAARRPGALLPRMVVDGRLGVRGLAGAIVGRSLLARALGLRSA